MSRAFELGKDVGKEAVDIIDGLKVAGLSPHAAELIAIPIIFQLMGGTNNEDTDRRTGRKRQDYTC